MQNPYNFQQPVNHPDRFFGRRSIFAKVYARIGASRPQSISIVGSPRIGKSSLLNYLASDHTRTSYLSDPEEYVYLLLPLKQLSELSIDTFYERLCKQLLEKCGGQIEVTATEQGYYQFKRIIEAVGRTRRKVILFLDDFHLITGKSEFPAEFYAYLRSLANNYNIAYVTSSHRDLQQLCALKSVERAPFFNIFTNMNLKPLRHQEAVQMIQVPFHIANIDMYPYAGWLLTLAGLFPHTLQLACYIAFEFSRNDHLSLHGHYPEIEEQFYLLANPFFEECWQQFDEDHKRVMELICTARKLKPSQKYLLDELLKHNYVVKENGYLQPFSAAFERFIAEKCGFRLGRTYDQHRFIGRVREWLR